MLNAKALSELLTQNRDDRLCTRWFIMTPNGTILAHSQPSDIKDLRRQAAMSALAWQEHDGPPPSDAPDPDGKPSKPAMPRMLKTLTMETESANLIIRRIQTRLLLALEGGVPPRKRSFEPRATPEGPGDAPYPAAEGSQRDSAVSSAASSVAESSRSSASLGVLSLQRRKLDALATAITEDFERTGFKMPEEGSTKFF